jgi:hypothetical protein
MVAKKRNPILDKDPMKMNREERIRWQQALIEDTIKPRVIGYADTEHGANVIIGKKKRCHIEKQGNTYLVIQAKSR